AFGASRAVLEPHARNVLLIGQDDQERSQIAEVVGGDDVQIQSAATGQDALAKIRDNSFAVAVCDLNLGDMTAFDLLEEIKKDAHLGTIPVIAYVSRELSKKEEAHLKRLGQTMNLKEARSLERLVDETALFLHND